MVAMVFLLFGVIGRRLRAKDNCRQSESVCHDEGSASAPGATKTLDPSRKVSTSTLWHFLADCVLLTFPHFQMPLATRYRINPTLALEKAEQAAEEHRVRIVFLEHALKRAEREKQVMIEREQREDKLFDRPTREEVEWLTSTVKRYTLLLEREVGQMEVCVETRPSKTEQTTFQPSL